MEANCPFCNATADRIAFAGELYNALWDGFPVSKGHLLLVPKRHVPTWRQLNQAEQSALMQAIESAQRTLQERFAPNGYNVGFNEGEAGRWQLREPVPASLRTVLEIPA